MQLRRGSSVVEAQKQILWLQYMQRGKDTFEIFWRESFFCDCNLLSPVMTAWV
jgi:hypothetical protein